MHVRRALGALIGTTLMVGCDGWGLAACTGEAVGRFDGDRRVTAIAVDASSPGGDLDAVLGDAESLIRDGAEQGGTLRVFVLRGGSAAAMAEVRLSAAAGGGDFEPRGGHRAARRAQAERYTAAALLDVRLALESAGESSATGGDLVGALNRVAEVAVGGSGGGRGRGRPAEAVLLTTGGVHRAEDVDLTDPEVSPANAAEAAGRVALSVPDGVSLRVVGVGRFDRVEPRQSFAAGVRAFWAALCAPLGDRCTLTTDGTR